MARLQDVLDKRGILQRRKDPEQREGHRILHRMDSGQKGRRTGEIQKEQRGEGKMNAKISNTIAAFSFLGLTISLFVMIGTAGAVDCDRLTLKEAVIRCSICMVVLILSAIGLTKMEKAENESEYDNL